MSSFVASLQKLAESDVESDTRTERYSIAMPGSSLVLEGGRRFECSIDEAGADNYHQHDAKPRRHGEPQL